VLGQAVFDKGVTPLNCRVADMHLGSHLVTEFAIVEQSPNSCWVLEDMFSRGYLMPMGGIYTLESRLHDILGLAM